MSELVRRDFLKAACAAVPIGLSASGSTLLAAERADELVELGARAAVEHIRRGDITAEAYYSRLVLQCERYAFLNGVASLDSARMVEAARDIDRARSRGEALGPAAGLPVAVKDQIAVSGYPAGSGNAALKSYRPARNAPVVDALVRAGAVPFAKATCPDMTGNSSLMAQEDSYSPAYGVVRNPYDPVRMAGGSSGGSGVMLAARMVPAALGEDTNGSIRLPSSFCGVVGLRPSTYTIDNALTGANRKRYSDAGMIIAAGRLDTIGPMARSVADVAFLDELVTGDRASPVPIRGARVAIPRPDYWDQEWVDPQVARVTQAAFAKLRDAGVTLVEIDYLALRATVGYLGGFTAMAMAAQLLNEDPTSPDDAARAWLAAHMPGLTLEEFKGVPAPYQPRDFGKFPELSVREQMALLRRSARHYRDIFTANNVLAIAAPTVPVLPQIFTPSGSTDHEMMEIKGKALDRAAVIITQTVIAPRFGAPSLSLPAGLAGALPVGLGLDGLPGQDADILGLGLAFEQVLGSVPSPQHA